MVASDDVNASHGLDRGQDTLGGDVLLRVPPKRTPEGAYSFARRLQGAVSECATGFCVSVGVASGAATLSLTGLPEHATAALLQAKDSGVHPIRTYS